MTTPLENQEPDPETAERFTVFGAYGEVMLKFQLLEMRLQSIAALGIRPGSNLEQGMAPLEGWREQPLGRIAEMLDLPNGTRQELLGLVEIRNRLAHHFYEDHPFGLRTHQGRMHALDVLATVHADLERLDERLGEYLKAAGVLDPAEVYEMLPDDLKAPDDFFD